MIQVVHQPEIINHFTAQEKGFWNIDEFAKIRPQGRCCFLQYFPGQGHPRRLTANFPPANAAAVNSAQIRNLEHFLGNGNEWQLVADHTFDQDHFDLLQVMLDFFLLGWGHGLVNFTLLEQQFPGSNFRIKGQGRRCRYFGLRF